MKPTCLTPGCALAFDHIGPHGIPAGDVYARQKVPDYVATGPSGTYNNGRVGTSDLLGVGRAQGAGTYHGPPSPPVTLEGLAAVISACGMSIHALGNDGPSRDAAGGHLLALIAKAREVACGKEQGATGGDISAMLAPLTAGEAVRSVHQRIAAMSPEEAERAAEAIAARDDAEVLAAKTEAVVYNCALHDALAALANVFGPSWLTSEAAVHAKEALQRLFRSTP